jgi:L-rhamnonate dehydratase
MHHYHLSTSSPNCPIGEYFPVDDIDVGNDLFCDIIE